MSYLGSKGASGAFQMIIGQMPVHDVYIETHLGGGYVMRAKKPALIHTIGCDIDPQTINDFRGPEGAEIIKGCCLDLLKSLDLQNMGRVHIYADPPYLWSQRSSKNAYRYEYDESDHRQLLQALLSLPDNVTVCISGYSNSLYDDLLSGWSKRSVNVRTRGRTATECIWFNYPVDIVKHDDRYLGHDAESRRAFRRKVHRWCGNFDDMPPDQQAVIITEMMRHAKFDKSLLSDLTALKDG